MNDPLRPILSHLARGFALVSTPRNRTRLPSKHPEVRYR